MADTSTNRRIGVRNDAAIPVTVELPPERKRGFRRIVVRKLDGLITQLSVSGAEIECRPLAGFQVPGRAQINGQQGSALVEVRRVEELPDGRVRYGALFVSIDPAFEAALHATACDGRDGQVDWHWNAAR